MIVPVLRQTDHRTSWTTLDVYAAGTSLLPADAFAAGDEK